jgi:hypothetical protein
MPFRAGSPSGASRARSAGQRPSAELGEPQRSVAESSWALRACASRARRWASGQFGKGGPEGWPPAASRAATERSDRAQRPSAATERSARVPQGDPAFLAPRAGKCPNASVRLLRRRLGDGVPAARVKSAVSA